MGRLKWKQRSIAGIVVVAKNEARVTVSVGLREYRSHWMMGRTIAVGLGLVLFRNSKGRAKQRESVAGAS